MAVSTLLLLLLAYLSPWMLESAAAAYIFPDTPNADLVGEIHLLFTVLTSMLVLVITAAVTMSVLLFRLARLDYRQLQSQDETTSTNAFRPEFSKLRFAAAILFFGVMHHAAGNGGMFIYAAESVLGAPPPVATARSLGEVLWARLTLPMWFGFPMICVAYVLTPIAILMQAFLLEVVFVISGNMSRLAKSMTVNLALLDGYSAVSNSFVRVVTLFCVIAAFLVMGTALLENDSLLSIVFIAAILIVLPFFVLLGRPIFVLSKRVKEQKQIQTRTIQVKLLNLPEDSAPGTRSDLLSEQLFIESRWEWPISTHLQKLTFFGLLPPLSWVLAAVIENLLY